MHINHCNALSAYIVIYSHIMDGVKCIMDGVAVNGNGIMFKGGSTKSATTNGVSESVESAVDVDALFDEALPRLLRQVMSSYTDRARSVLQSITSSACQFWSKN